MKIVFISNYLNHHQTPLCEAFTKIPDVEFTFFATQNVEKERVSMGYMADFSGISYFREAIEEKAKQWAEQDCFNADVVIFGSAPLWFVNRRIKSKKLTFCYSERWFKKGFFNHPKEILSAFKYFTLKGNKNYFQLCASAYTAKDSHRVFAFLNKTFRWGYFPKVKSYESVETLIKEKKKNSLLWVARFIDWKHPEYIVKLAKKLKEDGYNFEINMIGNGILFDKIDDEISKNQLVENVKLLGPMPPNKVREYMEQSEIFLFVSDKNEGWGAVLNEAMNSGCATVASRSIGAVPYLIDNGNNGLIYENDDFDEFYEKVKFLIDNSEKRADLGKNAYETMRKVWNADIAAKRFYEFCLAKLSGKYLPIYENGPMSKDNGWKK